MKFQCAKCLLLIFKMIPVDQKILTFRFSIKKIQQNFANLGCSDQRGLNDYLRQLTLLPVSYKGKRMSTNKL